MPNRLANETSPYLLQHADNPVDWYPWGEEALERARREDKPLLISIGYSACHWCHVMERESFEDAETARIMNEHFVNVKVDREERPDLDSIYMSAVQAMTRGGGWPMTVFATPEGVPFYGGTYFPPEDRHGLPSFRRVLLGVADAYRHRRGEVEQGAGQVREFLERSALLAPSPAEPDPSLLDQAARNLASQLDARHGGFGGAPKFPQPMALEFMLRYAARSGDQTYGGMAELSLRQMAAGGIYDQLGGGFHRYSVDAAWAVPHFEKMLYDNALLSHAYLAAYQATGEPRFRAVAEETLDYVRREMTSPEGGFYATQDADSEGVEGKFFTWTPAEVREVLDEPLARLACLAYGVTEEGNFEGKTVLFQARSTAEVAREAGLSEADAAVALAEARRRLLAARERRVHPGRDEKVIVAWNGLMLRSFAVAASALQRQDYRAVAERNAAFLLGTLRRDGRLLRTYKDGQAKFDGFLEDYANLADGLLALYEATFDLTWFQTARQLTDAMLADFWDERHGGFFDTGRSHERLVVRPKELTDSATPSGNSVAVDVLLRLAILTGQADYRRRASQAFRLVQSAAPQYPLAFGRWLSALDFYLGAPKEVALVGDPGQGDMGALLRTIYTRFVPNKVVALKRPGDRAAEEAIPLLTERAMLDSRATAYVCRNYACQLPVTEPAQLAAQLIA